MIISVLSPRWGQIGGYHMKRWHEEYAVFHRQWKKHRKMHVESNKNRLRVPGDCTCDDQVGRFRKRDAYDCGNSGCLICHSDKFPKRQLTEKEIVSDISFKEQLKDLSDADGM